MICNGTLTQILVNVVFGINSHQLLRSVRYTLLQIMSNVPQYGNCTVPGNRSWYFWYISVNHIVFLCVLLSKADTGKDKLI